MLGFFAGFIAISVVVLFVMMILAKDVFIQALFLSSGTNLSILMIVILGSYEYRDSYIDIALIYAFLTFIASQAILKYVGSKNE